LEIEGVLKSWAVPKEPPKEVGIKRLAMQTEDHPIEYLDFEGVIPKGQYGAGTVKIWDKGGFKLAADSAKKPEDGNLVFALQGKKLKGRYALIHIRDKQWLFFKTKG
jgi:DNA ligase D-like protein (predicted 3'-phosphoesterase)